MNKVEKKAFDLKGKILELWGHTDDNTALNMFIDWIGWDYMNDAFRKSIENYEGDVKKLEVFYRGFKDAGEK